ncbi:MAG: ABC transporter permease [Treponema sp.]|nr:ABC transporter permease [Treponema sp.]
MTLQLVIRNIIRNRKNSLVIFLLIAVITFLFFIGNSIMGQANAGLRKTYIESLTADVVIQKKAEMTMNLFGGNSPKIDDYAAIPTLPAFDHIIEILDNESSIENYTFQVSGRAALQMPEINDSNQGVLICGVEPDSYFNCFPGIIVEEGFPLRSGEYGAMITAERADRVEKDTGIRPQIGSPMLLSSAGAIGFRIREVPLTGIYHYENPGQFMNELVIADPQTVRVLQAIQVATASANDDELIMWDPDIWDINSDPDGIEEYVEEGFDPDSLIGFLDSQEEANSAELAGGDWNFILIRLKPGAVPSFFIKNLNKKLEPYNVFASGWRTAAGTSAIMMLLLQSFFNIGGFLVSIAGIIVVVNILLISVFRRTREIGTLRAIGASDSQIRFLILGENCIIAFLSGIAGITGGVLFLKIINSANITISNELVASLLGNSILRIGFLPPTAAVSFCIALFLGAAASLYPVETAVHIDPIVAVRQG